jgi:hypothetical protein
VITTAGDLIYGTAADTVARLGIGTAGQVLKVNSGATAPEWGAVAGGGKVLQVISGSTTTETTIASTTLTDTNLSATITPSLATSKILILVSQVAEIRRDTNQAGGGFAILRGATNIYDASNLSLRTFVDGTTTLLQRTISSLVHLDSPNTTSATTYKTQAKSSSTANSGVIVAQVASQPSTIILLEIGA